MNIGAGCGGLSGLQPPCWTEVHSNQVISSERAIVLPEKRGVADYVLISTHLGNRCMIGTDNV